MGGISSWCVSGAATPANRFTFNGTQGSLSQISQILHGEQVNQKMKSTSLENSRVIGEKRGDALGPQ